MEEYGNFTFNEVAMVAVIMGDCITKKLYAEVQKQGDGYMTTVDLIGSWAVEFAKKHEKTSWEKVLEEGMKPLSKKMKSIICWDDACIDYAEFKLENFKK